MNMYGGPIDLYYEEEKSSKNSDPGSSLSSAARFNVRKPDMGENTLTEEQILQLKGKYNLAYMTCEEEVTLLQDLNQMGILTKEECGAYAVSEGNIFESLTRQVSKDINLLYQMAIAGRYSNQHIEHIKSHQKLLDVLEQLMVE